MVAEIEAESQLDDTECRQRRRQIVGSAVWNISYLNKRKEESNSVQQQQQQQPPLPSQSLTEIMEKAGAFTRRDTDHHHHHLAATNRANEEVRAFFGAKYRTKYLQLRSLHVRQEFWRRGIASQLIGWGIATACIDEERLPLVVIATEIGEKVYVHRGFVRLGPGVAQVPGEDEFERRELMVYEYPRRDGDV